MDPANQLMATAAGDRRYFFNSAGFFVSEAAAREDLWAAPQSTALFLT